MSQERFVESVSGIHDTLLQLSDGIRAFEVIGDHFDENVLAGAIRAHFIALGTVTRQLESAITKEERELCGNVGSDRNATH